MNFLRWFLYAGIIFFVSLNAHAARLPKNTEAPPTLEFKKAIQEFFNDEKLSLGGRLDLEAIAYKLGFI